MGHVLATRRPSGSASRRRCRVFLVGELKAGVSAKDIILAIIAKIGAAGATGHVIEYAGPALASLSMEARLTICNMSIEAGGRAGMIAPDATTFAYLKGAPFAPQGEAGGIRPSSAGELWWSDPGAAFDREVTLSMSVSSRRWSRGGLAARTRSPSPGRVPDPATAPNAERRDAMLRAIRYMGLEPGQERSPRIMKIDRAFIGSTSADMMRSQVRPTNSQQTALSN